MGSAYDFRHIRKSRWRILWTCIEHVLQPQAIMLFRCTTVWNVSYAPVYPLTFFYAHITPQPTTTTSLQGATNGLSYGIPMSIFSNLYNTNRTSTTLFTSACSCSTTSITALKLLLLHPIPLVPSDFSDDLNDHI
jgi:hypothetical protein